MDSIVYDRKHICDDNDQLVRSFGNLIWKCSKKNPAWEVSEWWVGVSFQSRNRFHMVKISNHRGKIAQNQMIPSSKTSKTQAIN